MMAKMPLRELREWVVWLPPVLVLLLPALWLLVLHLPVLSKQAHGFHTFAAFLIPMPSKASCLFRLIGKW
jgi:hypothetical protein